MTFATPSLLWLAIPLLAATLAIHLLNLRRQRSVPWAAMDFLLTSERRNRTWINLKEWLLLALRLAAIALVVFALARPVLDSFQLAALAESRVLHVVVLDDSYSMADESADHSAWENALAAVARILDQAAGRQGQELAIIRTSTPAAGQPDQVRAAGGTQLAQLRHTVSQWRPSHTSGGLTRAIQSAGRLAASSPTGVRRIAYVITDTRRHDVRPLSKVKEQLSGLTDAGTQVYWINCVKSHSENLTLAGLEALPGPQAVGVEMTVSVAVKNNGTQPARGVLLQAQRDGRALPAVEIGDVAPGETAVRAFPLTFSAEGDHVLTAHLESDAVNQDNVRYAAVGVGAERRVLLVDDSSNRGESKAFAAALRPTGRTKTGWLPRVVRGSELPPRAELNDYASIVLLDVPTLPDTAANALVEYAYGGGGVLVLVGPNTDAEFYNKRLLGDSPRPLANVTLDKPRKPEAVDDVLGDLRVSDHPMFRVFTGERNSFLELVRVNYLYGLAVPEDDSESRVLASHRSGEPLVIESAADAGRVILMATLVGQGGRLGERWSNLSSLPVFPVLALETAAHLAAPSVKSPTLLVGRGWGEASLGAGDARVKLGKWRESGEYLLVREAENLAALPPATTPGAYRIASGVGSGARPSVVAVNIDPAEGDLQPADSDGFQAMLRELGVQFQSAAALSASTEVIAPSGVPPSLGAIALVLLLIEQALAVAASYHTSPGGGQRR